MPDYLSCGSCPVDFELTDIISFIEHKKQRCMDNLPDKIDFLECVKCNKRFHTPWPLLIHVQMEHDIIVVRNLDHLPESYQTNLFQESSMDTDVDLELELNDESENLENSEVDTENKNESEFPSSKIILRNAFTQTKKIKMKKLNDKVNTTVCCQPIPLCCQKVEPQCYDEACKCPTACTMDTCLYNQKLEETDNETKDLDNPDTESSAKSINCCACPQIKVKKESREVQTEFEFSEEVDINFLLSNSSGNNDNNKNDNDEDENGTNNEDFETKSTTTNDNNRDSDKVVDIATNLYNLNNSRPNISNNWTYFGGQQQQTPYQFLSLPQNNMELNAQQYQNLLSTDLAHRYPPNIHTPPLSSSPNSNSLISLLPPRPQPNFSLNNSIDHFNNNNNGRIYQNNTPLDTDLHTTNDISNSYNNNRLSISEGSINNDYLESASMIGGDINASNLPTNNNNANNKYDNDRRDFRFTCTSCQKQFRQKVHLRKHVMSQHNHHKPHRCDQCNYTTVEKSHLTVHIRTHTGERPYTCRRCSYSSAQNCTLKSHYLRRHPGDQITCELCGSHFITEQERNNHQRSCRIVNNSNLPQPSTSASSMASNNIATKSSNHSNLVAMTTASNINPSVTPQSIMMMSRSSNKISNDNNNNNNNNNNNQHYDPGIHGSL